MAAKRKAPQHPYNVPEDEVSQVRTRKMRKLDSEVQDSEEGGVPLNSSPRDAADAETTSKPSPINAGVHSERSQTPDRVADWPKRRQAEKEALEERSKREERWALKTAGRLPDTDAARELNTLISARWTNGWLMYFKRKVRPTAVSVRLLKVLAVVAYHLSIAEANGALVLQVSDRAFGPADVNDALTTHTGRMWSELKREALQPAESNGRL
ncbi:hypothetical protein LTR36_008129 [Oleoguttula mirabilis]|uniref:Uncharacterized protein n=1 Tax=Oleoguttula mirabilis TaxID=1507867 RepID=A0AAV9J8V8_9PEZI|nr:hypothetical protein LTR36_008129 [Oleoguttula mirabilis]